MNEGAEPRRSTPSNALRVLGFLPTFVSDCARPPRPLHPFQKRSRTEAASTAHRYYRATAATTLQFTDCLGHQPTSCSTKRMTERDRAAIGINPFHVRFE